MNNCTCNCTFNVQSTRLGQADTNCFKSSSLLSLKPSCIANCISKTLTYYLVSGRKTFLVKYATFLSSGKVTWLFRN
jgi:hypothetical protein